VEGFTGVPSEVFHVQYFFGVKICTVETEVCNKILAANTSWLGFYAFFPQRKERGREGKG
jgi:hypothetical protein